MRFFYSILLYFVALQVPAYLFMTFQIVPGIQYPFTLSNSLFDFSVVGLAFTGLGASAILISSILLRQGTYAIYATLIWVVGTIFNPIKTFFLALPNTLMGLFGSIILQTDPSYNPLYPTANLANNPIVVVLTYLVGFGIFWFFMEIIAQRNFS